MNLSFRSENNPITRIVKIFCFLLIVCSISACIPGQPYPTGIKIPQPLPPPKMRPPAIGQEWVYNVRNVFNQELVDVVTEKVVATSPLIVIERSGIKAGPLPDEIQGPWGYIIQDPHWSPPQKFIKPIPLWPASLEVGFSGYYPTRYEVVGYLENGSYWWDLNMEAIKWEQIKVPAGSFNTLQIHNEAPYFESNDVFRIASYRQEDIWLAPEIGRWVIRRSYGRYLLNGMRWSGALWEDYLEWQLISWK
jgi:hypothetical protein